MAGTGNMNPTDFVTDAFEEVKENFEQMGFSESGTTQNSLITTPIPVVGTDSTANQYICAIENLTSYAQPILIILQPQNTNTGSSTININSLGLKDILKKGGVALESGDIVDGGQSILWYNGIYFELLNPLSGGGGGSADVGKTPTYLVDTSTDVNKIECTADPSYITYTNGDTFTIKCNIDRPEIPVTININSLGEINLSRKGGTPIRAFDVVANGNILVQYNLSTSSFEIVNTQDELSVIEYSVSSVSSFDLPLALSGGYLECADNSPNDTSINIRLDSVTNFKKGSTIIIERKGTAEVSITTESGVTLLSESNKVQINAQYQTVALVKKDTNVWTLFGALK